MWMSFSQWRLEGFGFVFPLYFLLFSMSWTPAPAIQSHSILTAVNWPWHGCPISTEVMHCTSPSAFSYPAPRAIEETEYERTKAEVKSCISLHRGAAIRTDDFVSTKIVGNIDNQIILPTLLRSEFSKLCLLSANLGALKNPEQIKRLQRWKVIIISKVQWKVSHQHVLILVINRHLFALLFIFLDG